MGDPSKDPKYSVVAESVDELAAKLVYLMKLANEEEARKAKEAKQAGPPPHIDRMQFQMQDGSKVTVTLSKKPADGRCRRGIKIDGYSLG